MFAYSAHSCMRSTRQIFWHVTAFSVDRSTVSAAMAEDACFLACDENQRNGQDLDNRDDLNHQVIVGSWRVTVHSGDSAKDRQREMVTS